MTPEQRKAYNQKRYTPKRKRDSADGESNGGRGRKKTQDEFDALTTLERDVIKRTQQVRLTFTLEESWWAVFLSLLS